MDIYTDTILDYETHAKIKAALALLVKAEELIKLADNEGHRIKATIPQRIKELTNIDWTFIDKKKAVYDAEQTEKQQKGTAEQVQQERNQQLVQAQSDPELKDQLIKAYLDQQGFTAAELAIVQAQEQQDGKDMSEFWTARKAARDKIINEIKSAKANELEK